MWVFYPKPWGWWSPSCVSKCCFPDCWSKCNCWSLPWLTLNHAAPFLHKIGQKPGRRRQKMPAQALFGCVTSPWCAPWSRSRVILPPPEYPKSSLSTPDTLKKIYFLFWYHDKNNSTNMQQDRSRKKNYLPLMIIIYNCQKTVQFSKHCTKKLN